MNSRKLFWNDLEGKTPKTNIAINQLCMDLIHENTFDVIARVYTHSKGVILGNSESPVDINEKYCKQEKYEITHRPTGGSAIIVAPDLNVSYSVFFKQMSVDLHDIYKNITIPLAQRLGDNFSVQGNYYIRYNKENQSTPIAGHAMRTHKGVIQFDGVIQLRSFTQNEIANVLQLRELWGDGEKQYLKVNDVFYSTDGKSILKTPSNVHFLRSEKEELEEILGLENVGLSYEHFVSALSSSLESVFGSLSRDPVLLSDNQIKEYLQNYRQEYGARKYLGHCFVDLVDKEEYMVYSSK